MGTLGEELFKRQSVMSQCCCGKCFCPYLLCRKRVERIREGSRFHMDLLFLHHTAIHLARKNTGRPGTVSPFVSELL